MSFYGYSQKQDTIHVIMLVCDTSVHGKLLPYEIPNVYWIRGFQVKEEVEMKGYLIGDASAIFKQTIKYLDKNKKPVNLVVWESREI